jgi:arginine/lysine/ornithine decarboxylase
MFEDTPEFVARHIIREARSYFLDGVAPFFRRWSTTRRTARTGTAGPPGAWRSSRARWADVPQFFGENMLRADVCNSVDELGQLLDHTGPVADSEKNAARIFNADHCFFVTNGTSTRNKMV